MSDIFRDVSASFSASTPTALIDLFVEHGGRVCGDGQKTDVYFTDNPVAEAESRGALVSPSWIRDCADHRTVLDVRRYAPALPSPYRRDSDSDSDSDSRGRFSVETLPPVSGLQEPVLVGNRGVDVRILRVPSEDL